ncbi:YqeB family protein [Actinopolyspora mortivallis]|uniref:YqeB family protein n=1 Tax=Actinopolyspora mortivallis TaxID=33906 RepID=UPI0012ED60C1|nr:hypothetical protein [Actinopolyspora mortivallis]
MNDHKPRTKHATTVAEPVWLHVLYWIGFPVIGAAAGFVLRLGANWAQNLEWVPFEGPLQLLNSIPEPVATIGAIVLGVIAGIVLAYLAKYEALEVIVSSEKVVFRQKGSAREFPGSEVKAVFLEKKQLVLIGTHDEELAKAPTDISSKKFAEAFRAYGYLWTEEDPYADRFQRWVPDTPGLPTGADALLAARAQALENNKTDDSAELRAQLAKLGVVVKDEKKRQYWRLVNNDG